ILVVAAFALQNPQGVTVSFLAWTWQTDVGRLSVIAAALGAAAVLLLVGSDDLRLRLRSRPLARQLRRLEVRLAGFEAERDRLASRLDLGQQDEGPAGDAAAASPEARPQPAAGSLAAAEGSGR
ncbi:MAG: DUF1049 domain-containing protein, partial [Firmicutes bacterium]|nr:DUF1049 domain-containing protein [Bacillota bacterium]